MKIKSKQLDDGYEECLFDSTMILGSRYMEPTLYLFFDHKGVYKYQPVNKLLYDEFVDADSQGQFLREKILSNKNISALRMYKMKDFEHDIMINEITKHLGE